MEYQKNEFCRSMNCKWLMGGTNCGVNRINCCHTAKQFHTWLKHNGFKIIKIAPEQQIVLKEEE